MKDLPTQFSTVDAWRVALGLLPVSLRASDENCGQYVLMNGTSGNFCLDFVGHGDSTTHRATAWSCDVGHYVTFANDVVVHRWTKGATEERYSRQSVIGRIHDFHRYLERSAPDRTQSIVAHVLRIFRRIRAVENDGHRALRALLHLLASCASGQNRLSDTEFPSWGLAPETADVTKSITDATWQPLFNDLSGIGRYDIFRPDFSLVLRHASGVVFQDTHLEAERTSQLSFPGLEVPVTIDPNSVPTDAGAYFTPPALARTLAEEAIRNHAAINTPLFIFDPACGSGELLKECLRQLRSNQSVGHIRILGWDKSQSAVDMARFVLSWEARSWPADKIKFEVVKQDSMTADTWPTGVNILIMNPPFKNWNLMGDQEQALAKRFLGSSGKPNLALVFAFRALSALSEAATLAMIAPNSLLEGTAAKSVRKQMAAVLAPQLIARLGDQNVFTRALVDAAIYVGTKSSAQTYSATAVLWADSTPHSLNRALRGLRRWRGAESDPISETGFSIYKRDDVGRSDGPWIARGFEAWSSHEIMRNNKVMVQAKRFFDVKLGVRLGSDVFVVSDEYYNMLPAGERVFFRPAVMNPSIIDARLNKNHYVFYIHTPGLPPIASEQDLSDHVPTYFSQRLLPAKEKLAARRTLARGSQDWWELLEHRAWLETASSKIVSKYFGGARSFAFDQEGTFVVVVGNAWILQKGVLTTDITDDEVYLAMVAYLNSSIAEALLKYVSIQVSGGQSDLTKKYVASLLIPNLDRFKANDTNKLVDMGMAITNGTADWGDVDELVLSVLNR
jgi:adenine-specific DNA-methyltransferase